MEEKNYVWKEEDEFKFTGKEFEIMHNTLSSIFTGNLPQSQMYVMLHNMYQITANSLKRNIDAGIVQEQVEK